MLCVLGNENLLPSDIHYQFRTSHIVSSTLTIIDCEWFGLGRLSANVPHHRKTLFHPLESREAGDLHDDRECATSDVLPDHLLYVILNKSANRNIFGGKTAMKAKVTH